MRYNTPAMALSIQHGYTETPQGRVHYAHAGQGRAVLLLHGIGCSTRSWEPVMPLVAERMSVYALDMLGHGDSDKPRLNEPNARFLVPDWADNLVSFMEANGLAKACVAGNAIGGTIAVDLAARRPELVERLALLSCPGWDSEAERVERWRNVQNRLEPDGSAKPQSPADVGRNFALVTEAAIEQSTDDRRRAGPWYGNTLQAQYAYDTPALAQRITAPTIVAYGGMDFLRDTAQPLLRAIQGARFVTVPEASHIMPFDAPEAVAQLLLDFFTA